MKRVLATMGILAVLLWVNYAAAQVVTFTYTGQLTWVYGAPMGIQANIGDPIAGTLSWDPSQAPAFDLGGLAAYWLVPPSGMTATVGGATLTTIGGSFATVANDYPNDAMSLFVSGGSVAKDGQPTGGVLSLYMTDGTMTAFGSTALPSELDVGAFQFRTGGIYDNTGGIYRTIFFSIDSIDLPPPPPKPVAVDARYYNPNNIISMNSNGYVTVAVLTTDASSPFGAFDATTVDPSTVKVAGATPADFKYVALDGVYDLLLRFRVSGLVLDCGTLVATLMAKTWDGQALIGNDTLEVVGCK